MRIGILQPGYLPWLGFFEQIYRSDVFVLYDDVQFDKGSWRNRNRIKTAQGMQWLTVPVRFRFGDKTPICDVLIDSRGDWKRKHAASIRQSYSNSPFFKLYWPLFEEAFDHSWELLIDLDIYFITRLAACLGLDNRPLVRSSSLGVSGGRIERLIAICQHFKADIFYEGASGRAYIDDHMFAACGISIQYQEYLHPVYRQLYGKFMPYLSVIDLLFNHGDESREIIFSTTNRQGECSDG